MIVAFLVVIGPHALAQQPDFSKVEIKVSKVAGTVYMLQGQGGNIGVSAGDDGIVHNFAGGMRITRLLSRLYRRQFPGWHDIHARL